MACEPQNLFLVGRLEECSVFHGPKERHHHAQRVHGSLLPALMRVPQVRHCPVGGLEFLDQRAICTLADKVGCDEARATVDLRHLVGEHVAVVVVASHSEPASRPPDDLHRSRIADEVHKVATRGLEQARCHVLLLVIRVEDFLHLLPKALLPLKDSLLGDHVWHNVGLQAPREEDVRQILNIVERIVIHDYCVFHVVDLAAIDDRGPLLHILREECREDATFAN
mmetsp:Transcript_34874/g.88618  ORF Transcript_34874/g.88618 Transcript_34874/m.88618 type:complete len:225 (+) Transcript_34874:537-1211(+)